MTQEYEILKDSKDGSFQGDEGEKINYYYTKAMRVSDGVTLEFGGKLQFKKGEKKNLEIEKSERADGKGFRYKLVS